MEQNTRLEEIVRVVSELVAEAFGMNPIRPAITFATQQEIEKMLEKGGLVLGHNASFTKPDGTIVIAHTGQLDGLEQKISLYQSLAAEFAHFYRKTLGTGVDSTFFDYDWFKETQLRSVGRFQTLFLPRAVIEESVIPRGKEEMPDSYCQSYVLGHLGMEKAAIKYERESRQWPELIELILKDFRPMIAAVGGYNALMSIYTQMLRECDTLQIPLNKHNDYIIGRQFFHLCNALGYWMSGVIRRRVISDDSERFKEYVRNPVLPVTQEDIILFEQALNGLNQRLTEHRQINLGYNKSV